VVGLVVGLVFVGVTRVFPLLVSRVALSFFCVLGFGFFLSFFGCGGWFSGCCSFFFCFWCVFVLLGACWGVFGVGVFVFFFFGGRVGVVSWLVWGFFFVFFSFCGVESSLFWVLVLVGVCGGVCVLCFLCPRGFGVLVGGLGFGFFFFFFVCRPGGGGGFVVFFGAWGCFVGGLCWGFGGLVCGFGCGSVGVGGLGLGVCGFGGWVWVWGGWCGLWAGVFFFFFFWVFFFLSFSFLFGCFCHGVLFFWLVFFFFFFLFFFWLFCVCFFFFFFLCTPS